MSWDLVMKFTWHLLVIVAAILLGVCLYQRGQQTVDMTSEQVQEAGVYRNYAFVLWAIAIAIALYYYYVQGQSVFGRKANMCGKAHMCGRF